VCSRKQAFTANNHKTNFTAPNHKQHSSNHGTLTGFVVLLAAEHNHESVGRRALVEGVEFRLALQPRLCVEFVPQFLLQRQQKREKRSEKQVKGAQALHFMATAADLHAHAHRNAAKGHLQKAMQAMANRLLHFFFFLGGKRSKSTYVLCGPGPGESASAQLLLLLRFVHFVANKRK
jgi:hypothetical protein